MPQEAILEAVRNGEPVATLVLHAVATPEVEEMDAPRGG
jgi:hypothetical protein